MDEQIAKNKKRIKTKEHKRNENRRKTKKKLEEKFAIKEEKEKT